MRKIIGKIIGWMLVAVATSAGVPAFAASTNEFYTTLLRRGISEVDAGRHEAAVTPLRLAAFGLVESIDQYETAQAYLAIAFDKLGRQDSARDAAQRVIAAERVERKFAALPLPESTRTAFTAVARKVLSAPEVTALTTPAKPGATPPPPIAVKPASPPAAKPATTTTNNTTAPPPATKPATPTTTTTVATKPANPPAPKPAATPTTTNPTPITKPAQTATAKPVVPTPPPATQPARVDVGAKLAAGDRALIAANLVEARRAYREVLDAPGVDHATYIRVGEGFYRARDFANALVAFQRAGSFRNGEEAYHYYVAVAAYETGDYERAKRELNAALPHIEVTDDVQRYRTKIEGSR